MRCPRRSEHAGPDPGGRRAADTRPAGARTGAGHLGDAADLADDRGSVTVEAAIGIGTLVLVAAVAIGGVAAMTSSIRCVDAARELARLAARGEADRGREAAAGIAPARARMDLHTEADTVTVSVSAAPLGVLPLEVGGTAVAALEPGGAQQ